MPIPEQALLIVCFTGILQAFLLSLVIFFYPKGDRSVNVFLAAYIVSFSLPMCSPIVLHYTTWHNAILLRSALLLSGPTLYLYVLSFKEVVRIKKVWPHFIPFLIQLVFDWQLYFATVGVYPPANVPPPEIVSNPFTITLFGLRILQMLVYYILCSRALTHYQRTIQHLYSETSRINLSWLRWLINGNLALLLVMVFLYPFVLSNPDQFKLFGLLNVSAVIPYVYIATFKGLTQPTLWQIKPGLSHEKVEEEIREAETIEEETVQERKKSIVSEEKTAEIVSKAITLMETDKIFRATDLTLQELADRIEMPAYQVSQAINEGLKKNFYDLVNSYRVEEAKRLLLDPKTRNHKILALAQDAGFNSKTTFNTVFKKFTGHSPTEFRESQRVAEPV